MNMDYATNTRIAPSVPSNPAERALAARRASAITATVPVQKSSAASASSGSGSNLFAAAAPQSSGTSAQTPVILNPRAPRGSYVNLSV